MSKKPTGGKPNTWHGMIGHVTKGAAHMHYRLAHTPNITLEDFQKGRRLYLPFVAAKGQGPRAKGQGREVQFPQ
eukprot:3153248-Pyramimonas_sp.AAC.1